MSNQLQLTELKELIKLRNEQPDDYTQFLADFKEVSRDLMKVVVEVGQELEKEMEGGK